MKETKRTAFKAFESLLHVFFTALALLEFLELHLLSDLLAFAFASPRLALCNTCTLVEQALSDAFHVRVRLDHFRKKVVRSREREVVICSERARSLCTMEGLFIAT